MNAKDQYILGIHDGHNASVCLLKNGETVFAIQEERLCRTKNFWGFPFKSIQAALDFEKITANDIDCVAMAGHHVAQATFKRNILEQYKDEAGWKGKAENVFFKTPLYSLFKSNTRQQRLNHLEKAGLKQAKVEFVEHHLCHAAAVYFGLNTPKDEDVLVLTADGSGDGLCSTVSIANNGHIKRIASTDKGHSLGNIYSRVTFMLGFVPWEHEYKLMGMAPYASDYGREKATKVFNRLIGLSESNPLTFERKTPEPTTLIYSRLRRETERMRFDWVCAGLQQTTEDVLCRWVQECVEHTGIRKVALSGGVFMNVKANKRIMELESVDQLFVMPSCGDETNSFGAAYSTFEKLNATNQNSLPSAFPHFYLGGETEDKDIERALKADQAEGKVFEYKYVDDIERAIAQLLADKQIVARAKGRMEFGARALGNRSILADPSHLDLMRDLNLMVKKRDFWMPFAPVTRKDDSKDYAQNDKQFDSPYMMLSFDTDQSREEFLAAVHMADYTARFQFVDEKNNPAYTKIIQEFKNITGRGVLLNTSFNLHGLPIVNTPEDAMHVFHHSGLQYLALGNYLVSKCAA